MSQFDYWNNLRATSVKKWKEKQKLKPRKIRELKRKRPLSQKSKKQLERLKIYKARRDAYFKLHPVCEFPGCNNTKIDLHHKKGRTGDLLIDDTNFCSLCRKHHNWVELHVMELKKWD